MFREFEPVSWTEGVSDRIQWTRLNAHYRPLIALCDLILRDSMVDIAGGSVRVRGFTLRMHEVFEKFVRNALRQSWAVSDVELPDNSEKLGLRMDKSRTVRLIPDLALVQQGHWRFVGDVKYKHESAATQSDLYQLLTYATAAGLPSATLIYASGDGSDKAHDLRNTNIRLNSIRLDLSAPPAHVLTALARRVPRPGVAISDDRGWLSGVD